MQQWKRILIAVDQSPASVKAAEAGCSLAHRLAAEIAVVCVVDRQKAPIDADLGVTEEENSQKMHEEADQTIDEYIRLYNGIGKVTRFMPEGDAEEEIVRLSKEWGAELIAMGTHGRTGLTRMLSGSVAEQVIRHAGLPVLVTAISGDTESP